MNSLWVLVGLEALQLYSPSSINHLKNNVIILCVVHLPKRALKVIYLPSLVALDMAHNRSWCETTDKELTITSLVYSGLSFLSLIAALISFILHQCFCREKPDPINELFSFLMFSCCSFELCETFQWFILLKDFVGCEILGAVREYIIISILVIFTCLGAHLLILITQPKCLQVIKEVKQKRYKTLKIIYFFAAYGVPLLFVPWPFIGGHYGSNGYVCWLGYDRQCNSSEVDVVHIMKSMLMWHIWGVVVWLFTVGVISVAFYRCCVRRQCSVTKLRTTSNVNIIITLMIVFITQTVANGSHFVWSAITVQPSFQLAIVAIVFTPLSVMVFSLTLIIRKVSIINAGLENRQWDSERNLSTYNFTSYRATSHFDFIADYNY